MLREIALRSQSADSQYIPLTTAVLCSLAVAPVLQVLLIRLASARALRQASTCGMSIQHMQLPTLELMQQLMTVILWGVHLCAGVQVELVLQEP